MGTSQDEIQYFLLVDGQKRGPYPFTGLVAAGMQYESMIWWEGLESWARAGKIAKFAALLEQDRRERQAARRADRLPDPQPIRRIGGACLLAILVAAAVCLLGSSMFLASLVLWGVIQNTDPPPAAQPSQGFVLTATVLFFGGIVGNVLGFVCFTIVAVLLTRLRGLCRAVMLSVAPTVRADKVSVDVSDLQSEMTNLSVGPTMPALEVTDLSWIATVGMRGGGGVLMTMISVPLFTLVGMMMPLCICMIKPELAGQLITLVILLGIYAVLHIPIAIYLLLVIHRTGLGLNAVIDMYGLYRARVPWAPIGLSFWASIAGVLMLSGPFSLVFFGLLAGWVRKATDTATQICGQASRDVIAMAPAKQAETTSKSRADIRL